MSYAGIPGWQRQRPRRCVEGCRRGATGLSSGWWQVHGSHLALKVEQQGKNIEKHRRQRFFEENKDFFFGKNKLLNVSTITFKHSLTGPMCFFVFIVFPRRESPSWPCLWGQNFASHRGTQDGEATFLTELGKSGDFFSKERSKFGGEIWDFFPGVFQGITF